MSAFEILERWAFWGLGVLVATPKWLDCKAFVCSFVEYVTSPPALQSESENILIVPWLAFYLLLQNQDYLMERKPRTIRIEWHSF